MKLRPDTSTNAAWGTGYRRNEDQVKGFSHVHEWTLSGVQVMPTTGTTVPKTQGDTGWQSHVDHDVGEIAEPGYHRLHLDRYGIDAELTATDRVGMHRYRYEEGGQSDIIVNLAGQLGEARMDDAHVERVGDRSLAGWVNQRGKKTQAVLRHPLRQAVRLDARLGERQHDERRADRRAVRRPDGRLRPLRPPARARSCR